MSSTAKPQMIKITIKDPNALIAGSHSDGLTLEVMVEQMR